jgi:ketosteroid isomerase-like protein
MSQENVELVRQTFAAFNRGDPETAAGLFHPEVEWHAYLGAPGGSVHRGREALIKMWRDLNDNLGGAFGVEALEIIGCEGDLVVAVVEARGTGTESGAQVHQRWAQLYSIRDGLVFRVKPFQNREAALRAAGLSE